MFLPLHSEVVHQEGEFVGFLVDDLADGLATAVAGILVDADERGRVAAVAAAHDGYALGIGDSLKAAYPIEALNMALRRIEGMEHNLIHHSDRGVQYACSEYIKILKDIGIRISMTETGDPKDNSQAERINNTMKNELLTDMVFRDIEEVRYAVAKAVDFYNNRRPHMSIDMMTPAQAALCVGEITKKWTSYREIAIRNKQENDTARLEIPEKGLPLPPYMGSPSGLRPLVNLI